MSLHRCARAITVADDPFLDALTALEGVLADNAPRETLIKKRIAEPTSGAPKPKRCTTKA